MLYEMLAGEPPFTGETAQTIVAKLMTTTPVPIRELRPSVPVRVAAAIDGALCRRSPEIGSAPLRSLPRHWNVAMT
jgi:serine/threonine-protein kinase